MMDVRNKQVIHILAQAQNGVLNVHIKTQSMELAGDIIQDFVGRFLGKEELPC